MFLLFLMVLGTAGVKAQVRIGGNTAPNASAVLDLNATDAINNGTKGLGLPRVSLTSDTMKLTTGVANLYGMIVYNTSAIPLQAGIYYWNNVSWIKASLPSTSAADSGKFLQSNGSGLVFASPLANLTDNRDYGWTTSNLGVVTWTKILDHNLAISFPPPSSRIPIIIHGLTSNAWCRNAANETYGEYFITRDSTIILVWPGATIPVYSMHLICYSANI